MLRQHGLLMAAWQSRAITRQDPAWHDFDAACAQIQAAEQAVTRAEQDLPVAQRAHQQRLYDDAAAEVAGTEEGQAALAEIAHYEQLYSEAVLARSPKQLTWSMSLAWARNRFKGLVHVRQGLVQPIVVVPDAAPERTSAAVLAQMQRSNPARLPYR